VQRLVAGSETAVDRFQSNSLTEWALKSDATRAAIGRLYFHKRSAASDVQPSPALAPSKARTGTDPAG